jgi:hypothetical protein
MGLTYNSGVTNDDTTKTVKPLLAWVSHGGSTVHMADLTWGILPDALGVYIGGTGAKLEDQVFIAHTSGSSGGTLNDIYVTFAVPSDDRIVSSQVDGQIANSTIPDIKRMVDYGQEYQYIAPAPSLGSYSTGGARKMLLRIPGKTGVVATTPTDIFIDHQSGLDQRVIDEHNWRNTAVDAGMVVLQWIETTYDIGMVVDKIDDKGVEINSVIVGRDLNFQNQTTTLHLSDERYSFRRKGISEDERINRNVTRRFFADFPELQ